MVMSDHSPVMDTTTLRINSDRLWDDFLVLSQIGATSAGGVSRPALSLEDLEARAWFADCVEEAGFFVKDDDAGNLSGVWFSDAPNAKTMIIGSHLDTVPNGGRYDGAIGVLAALEVARTLRDAGIELPFHLEVIDFTDEEGTWFSLLGSRGLTARIAMNRLATVSGADGAFRAALARAGINVEHIHRANRDPETVCGFIELHIEQGGTLDRLGVPVGIVDGIVGRATNQLTFRGESGHSGTTDLYRRKDALQGAALFVTRAHMLAHDRFDGTVVNCGGLEVYPGTFNVIPERATLLVECRHVESDKLIEIEAQLLEIAEECASSYGLRMEHKRVEYMDAAIMHTDIVSAIQTSCEQLELSYRMTTSYAGHDAQPMSKFTRAGMIFIPSVNGISHTPEEFTNWEDVVAGANVLLHSILLLAAGAPPR